MQTQEKSQRVSEDIKTLMYSQLQKVTSQCDSDNLIHSFRDEWISTASQISEGEDFSCSVLALPAVFLERACDPAGSAKSSINAVVCSPELSVL